MSTVPYFAIGINEAGLRIRISRVATLISSIPHATSYSKNDLMDTLVVFFALSLFSCGSTLWRSELDLTTSQILLGT